MVPSWYATRTMLASRPIAVGILAVLSGASPSRSTAPDSPEKALQSKGLRERGSRLYVLPAERDFDKRLASLQKRNTMKRVAASTRELRETEARRDEIELGEVPTLIEQRRIAKAEMERAESERGISNDYNRLVLRYNELTDRMRELDAEYRDLLKNSETLAEAIGKDREQYLQELLDLRHLADDTMKEYAALADDPDVKSALASLNRSRKTEGPIAIGPSNAFQQSLRALEKLEKAVSSESIELRSQHGVLWVDTVINDKHRKSLVLDTGATFVSLPAPMADGMGLKTTATDRSVQIKLADGRIMQAKLSRIKSLRIGKVSAENVLCAILPDDLRDAVPLLGQTFLRNFSYKIDTSTRKLSIWKLEIPMDEPPDSKKPKPRGPRK